MASTSASVHPGEIIAGRYRIEGWVGQGNMAMVFHATHLGTGGACALKLVHSHLVERPEIQEMFVQEARLGARIKKNPYIVDVFDAGIDADRGVPFLAMDLLEGTTLDNYKKQYGQMPPGLLKTLWVQLADALGQAHAAGVVHRDLKPGNLFLTYDRKGNPQLRIVDFGIAKLMEEGVQRTATQIGTPAYSAPEQLGNGMRMMAERFGYNVSTTISPATDIWALGIVTYEMLIGAPAGQLWTGLERGAVGDVMILVATGPIPSATARAGARAVLLPPGFDAWLERCLQKNTVDRWPSVEVAVQHLIHLFDTTASKLGTIKIPTVEHSPEHRSTPNTTLLLPPNSGIHSTPANPSPREKLDSLTGSTPPSPTPQIDGTAIGISGTLTPKRAKHARKVGLVIVATVLSLATLILILGLSVKEKPANAKMPLPTAPIESAAPVTSKTPQVFPDPPPTTTPEPVATESPAIPAPTASLSEKMPAPKTSTNAPPPEPVASTTASETKSNEPATLNFNSIPTSKIIFDGKPLGGTPKTGVSTTPGTHTVVFVHPEKGKKTVSVTIKAGDWKTVAVKF